MKRAVWLFSGIFLVFSLFGAQSPVLAQVTRKLILGMPSISGGLETYYIAKKIGAYNRHGLGLPILRTASPQPMPSSAPSVKQ